MRYPLDKIVITQGYHLWHKAIDLAAPQGTKIKAPEAGIIEGINNYASAYFGGLYIILKGKSGRRYYMGHNSRNRVRLGQVVKEGQHIGDVGSTGQATGPHIHYQIWNKSGQLVNPVKETASAQKPKSYKVKIIVPMALVRKEPNRKSRVVRVMYYGQTFDSLGTVNGQKYKGSIKWEKSTKGRYVHTKVTKRV